MLIRRINRIEFLKFITSLITIILQCTTSSEMADKNNLLLMFERPNEPIFTPKGKDNAVFEVPDNFLTEKYQPIGAEIQSRFGEEAGVRIPVQNITLPDLKIPMQLGRQENFSVFIPKHRKVAGRLIDIFMGVRSINDLQSVAAYSRDRVNPQLFNYALSVALLHRPDTKGLDLPQFSGLFPDKFIDSRVFERAREEATIVPQGSRRPIIIPRDYTASDLEEEHRLWYFREVEMDMGINLHHWHWHLVYPFEASDRRIVEKDRRGELFYYMHQQIVARYNFERFSNRLARVGRLNNFRAPIPEGYFPKLDSLVASRSWPARISGATLKDLNRELDQVRLDLSDLERWRERFFEAVNQGAVVDASGNRIPLDERRGIDILGNMMEASILTPNSQLYGDLHNMGHVVISYSHDPDHRHLESFGVMGDSATAMRDPIFYKWHAWVDDIFQAHKVTLTPYTTNQLSYPGITLQAVQIQAEGGRPNTVNTHWQQSDLNLAKGMDFVPRGDVFARFTHLQHVPYTISIQVNNDSGAQRLGMVRVFLAPKFDDRGSAYLFKDQRLMMIELDKFVAALRPGQNILKRRSTESTVTIPYDRTFRNLDSRPTTTTGEEQFNFCGCGWPQHMLIPKGTAEGLRSELFVMISNYDQDRVNQELTGTCNDAASYCGVRDRLYPDQRAMGYPFDRLARAGAENLASFLTPNMRTQDVSIVFNDRTVDRPRQ